MLIDDLFTKTTNLVSKIYEFEGKLEIHKRNNNVTGLQLNILKILYFDCSRNVSSLSKCLNISLPNCSREVKKLTLGGYIEKRACAQDKRETFLHLTSQGTTEVDVLLSGMKELFISQKSSLSEEKIKLCMESIDCLMNNLLS